MSRLATLQIIWPPVPTLIFCAMTNWIASFGSMLITALAFAIYTYAAFAPALIALLWPKQRSVSRSDYAALLAGHDELAEQVGELMLERDRLREELNLACDKAAQREEYIEQLHAERVQGHPAQNVLDTGYLDFLDRNLAMNMGWRVGIAPAGNVSVSWALGCRTSIREAIADAMGHLSARVKS